MYQRWAETSAAVLSTLQKSGKLVNCVKISTLATEKIETLFGKTLVNRNEIHWNSKLKMVRRLLEVDLSEVVMCKDLLLTGDEKAA